MNGQLRDQSPLNKIPWEFVHKVAHFELCPMARTHPRTEEQAGESDWSVLSIKDALKALAVPAHLAVGPKARNAHGSPSGTEKSFDSCSILLTRRCPAKRRTRLLGIC